MDAKTAITLRQKARKNQRRAFAGQNVNDMRYSCQGFMGRHAQGERSVRSASASLALPEGRGVAGGAFPCAEDGPCQNYHCLPCDFECGEQECGTGIAGGIAPYAECGPCAFTHCMGCGYEIEVTPEEAEAIAGGMFPPTCDYCAPCVYQSTCTPCQGPARQQRWGNQYTSDDFGGRMCFRPCPPDPCHPETPPDDRVPPVRVPKKTPPKRMPKKPPVNKVPPKRMPKKPPPTKRPCPEGWVRPVGSNFCVPGQITTPCPPDGDCCVVLVGDFLLLKCSDTTHPWHGMDVTKYGNCYGANGNSICELHWTDECGEHWLELPLCMPDKKPPIIQSFPSKPRPTVPTGPGNITAAPTSIKPVPAIPVPPYKPVPGKPSPTPKAALAFAGGRVRTPSNGVGRR